MSNEKPKYEKTAYLRMNKANFEEAFTVCATLNKKHNTKNVYSVSSLLVWLLEKRHKIVIANCLKNITKTELEAYEIDNAKRVILSKSAQREAILSDTKLSDAQKIASLRALENQ